jgi:hypothetical protein
MRDTGTIPCCIHGAQDTMLRGIPYRGSAWVCSAAADLAQPLAQLAHGHRLGSRRREAQRLVPSSRATLVQRKTGNDATTHATCNTGGAAETGEERSVRYQQSTGTSKTCVSVTERVVL